MVQTELKKIIILGASGSSLDILSIINQINLKKKKYQFVGYLDDNINKVSKKYKNKVLGKFKDINKFKGYYFAIGIGNEKNYKIRKGLISDLKIPTKYFPNIIHPSALINDDIEIGHGNIIHAYVTISRDVKIDNFVNILPKVTVNHDVNIKSYTIINSNTVISGDINIGENCYIGQGSNLRDHINIGDKTLIGMGSVVTKDLEGNFTYFGNPAKIKA